jgi:hypothetical protein
MIALLVGDLGFFTTKGSPKAAALLTSVSQVPQQLLHFQNGFYFADGEECFVVLFSIYNTPNMSTPRRWL